MRLTDEVLKLSDSYHSQLVGKAFTIATAGRFGLFPSSRSFKIDLDFNNNELDVTSLSCLAITRGGCLIDVDYKSDYAQPFFSRVRIPDSDGPFLLLALLDEDAPWKDTNDGACEPEYSFCLIEEYSPVPDNAIPLARIVNDMGWREDNQFFLPPCLYISSHVKYKEQRARFASLLNKMDMLVPERLNTEDNVAKRILLPLIQKLMIYVEQEQDIMSPESLLARIQECLGAFFCASKLDQDFTLSEAEKFHEFSLTPCQYRSTYQRILEGLEYISGICVSLERLQPEPIKKETKSVVVPYIAETDILHSAVSNDVRIKVSGIEEGATVYYSVDGANPQTPLLDGKYVPLNPGFSKTGTREKDRKFVVKLRAELDKSSSSVGECVVTVRKDVNVWKGFQI